jgi:DNA-binding CsgD family transcriptional regulator
LRLAEAYVASFEGRHQDVLTLLPNPDFDQGSNEDAIAAASLRCVSIAALGDMRRAADAAIPIELAIRRNCVSDHTAREIRGTMLQVLLLCGDFSTCAEYLAMVLTSDEAPSRVGGIAEIVPGLIELHQGNTKGAMALLEAGARQLNYQDEDALCDLASASCAFAAALRGDAAKTDLFLAQIGRGVIPASWLTGRLTRYYELRARSERGNETDFASLLLKEADHDAGVSAVAPALHFLVAAGCDSTGVGDKLCDLSKTAHGSFADLCSKLGKGVKEHDNQLLLELCRKIQQSGNVILARDIARFSVSRANSSGDRLAIRAAHRAHQMLEDFFRCSVSDPDTSAISMLTARECEVANAAAAGISNRRIAEHMHVSVRTVEGHLYQVYAKLHVASRAELRELVDKGRGGTEAGPATKGK